jgi:predicted deacylase
MLKSNSHNRITSSFLKILTGSALTKRSLAYLKISSNNEGPVVWLCGGVHGDEVGGIVVIQEIFKKIRKSPLIRGSIHAFPLMNPIGFETGSRNITLSEEDLNRSFPGDSSGSLAERIAYKIFTTIIETNPNLVLDLHNDWRKSIPYAIIDVPLTDKNPDILKKILDFSKNTGFLLIGEKRESASKSYLESTLSGSIIKNNIPALTLELGESFVVNENNVKFGVKSIWNILSKLGMVEPDTELINYPVPEFYKDKVLIYSDKPIGSTSGIIRFKIKPGDSVKKKQPIARIYNIFGKIQETLVAPHDGIILGYSDSSVTFPGVPAFAFGYIEE